jgi:hypothetical protein
MQALRLTADDVEERVASLRTLQTLVLEGVAPDTEIRISLSADGGFSLDVNEVEAPGDFVDPGPLQDGAAVERLQALGLLDLDQSPVIAETIAQLPDLPFGEPRSFSRSEIAGARGAAELAMSCARAVGAQDGTTVDTRIDDTWARAVARHKNPTLEGRMGDVRLRARITETDTDLDDDTWVTSARPLLLVEAEATVSAAEDAMGCGAYDLAAEKRQKADALFRRALAEGGDSADWSAERTAQAYASFLLKSDEPRPALEVLAPWVQEQVRRSVPGRAWSQTVSILNEQILDVDATLALFARMAPDSSIDAGGETVASTANLIAVTAEYRERKVAAERDPSVGGAYAERLLSGLVDWADLSGDQEVAWELRSTLGRYYEKVRRLEEARAVYEGVLGRGGVAHRSTVDRLSLMMERDKEYAQAVELIENALADGMVLSAPVGESIGKRLARCQARTGSLSTGNRRSPGGITLVHGVDEVEIVHSIAFKGSPRVDAGYIVDKRLWLRGELKGKQWATCVDHRGDGTWVEVDPAAAPDPVIATGPDGHTVREVGGAAGSAPLIAYRNPAATFGMLTAHGPDGSVTGTFPSGIEVVAGIGGWCVRDLNGAVRVYNRDGRLRWSVTVDPRFDLTGWRGTSMAASEDVVVCTQARGMIAFDPAGTVVWRAATNTSLDDVVLAGNLVGVIGLHHVVWYDTVSGRRRKTEDLKTRLARRFVRDVDAWPVALENDRDHVILLSPDGARIDVHVPVRCSEWWGWQRSVVGQHAVAAVVADATGRLRLHATFPRRLNMLVRDGALLLCVLNPLTVLRSPGRY